MPMYRFFYTMFFREAILVGGATPFEKNCFPIFYFFF